MYEVLPVLRKFGWDPSRTFFVPERIEDGDTEYTRLVRPRIQIHKFFPNVSLTT